MYSMTAAHVTATVNSCRSEITHLLNATSTGVALQCVVLGRVTALRCAKLLLISEDRCATSAMRSLLRRPCLREHSAIGYASTQADLFLIAHRWILFTCALPIVRRRWCIECGYGKMNIIRFQCSSDDVAQLKRSCSTVAILTLY